MAKISSLQGAAQSLHKKCKTSTKSSKRKQGCLIPNAPSAALQKSREGDINETIDLAAYKGIEIPNQKMLFTKDPRLYTSVFRLKDDIRRLYNCTGMCMDIKTLEMTHDSADGQVRMNVVRTPWESTDADVLLRQTDCLDHPEADRVRQAASILKDICLHGYWEVHTQADSASTPFCRPKAQNNFFGMKEKVTYFVSKSHHEGVYSLLIVDEAQKLKNTHIHKWSVMHVHKFPKIILATATPMFNAAQDLIGLSRTKPYAEGEVPTSTNSQTDSPTDAEMDDLSPVFSQSTMTTSLADTQTTLPLDSRQLRDRPDEDKTASEDKVQDNEIFVPYEDPDEQNDLTDDNEPIREERDPEYQDDLGSSDSEDYSDPDESDSDLDFDDEDTSSKDEGSDADDGEFFSTGSELEMFLSECQPDDSTRHNLTLLKFEPGKVWTEEDLENDKTMELGLKLLYNKVNGMDMVHLTKSIHINHKQFPQAIIDHMGKVKAASRGNKKKARNEAL
ncbi:uncharacterized protein BDV14DRAFT_196580 [Aspergillus stella-maris]|uniref:uncharacterized protein n=1 Tax=Aspergillus stella-maris TaxID=1810926 RepID=UPI003CCDCB3C